MSVIAGEIEKAESRDRSRLPRQYTEEYRLEAVEYYSQDGPAEGRRARHGTTVGKLFSTVAQGTGVASSPASTASPPSGWTAARHGSCG